MNLYIYMPLAKILGNKNEKHGEKKESSTSLSVRLNAFYLSKMHREDYALN